MSCKTSAAVAAVSSIAKKVSDFKKSSPVQVLDHAAK